ncbi:YbjQ family protein [Cellulomonas sp. URHD0024]|uniref:YbjQ family protein n=1 Tax=Cellulomonas sp. URHD0024 TaxID=1302620 RepID=UPI00041D3A57|nr:YbjQ family protein [Cellulomonas sp. URHD0024]
MNFLVSTMNDAPGYRVQAVLGEVTGLTVRARNVGVQIGAAFKAFGGGELKGLTTQLQQTRDEAMQRMVEAAMARGANAVLAMRFDANEVANGYQEVVAYGTAVVIVQA